MPNDPPLWTPRLADLAYAAGLLTRMPIPVDGQAAMARGADAAWAFPIVGFGLALIYWGLAAGLTALGVPPTAAALCTLAALTMMTGAMHLDGFSDVLDGFWGGWDTNQRLAIMKDSQLGVYGTVGLVLVVGLQVTSLAVIQTDLTAVLAIFGFSRALMLVPMGIMPHARDGGLSRSVGTPPKTAIILGMGIGGGAILVLSPLTGLLMVAGMAAVAWTAHRKIGGQTGDVLGATQVVTETLGLLTLVALAA